MDKQKSPVWKAKSDEPSLIRYIGYDKCNYSVGKKRRHFKNGICENENNCVEGDGFEGRDV